MIGNTIMFLPGKHPEESFQQVRQSRQSAVEQVTAHEQRALILLVTEAQNPVSEAGSRRERYESMADSQMQVSLRTVLSLQADRRKYGAGDLSGLEGEAEVEGASPAEEEEEVAGTAAEPVETGTPAGAARGEKGRDQNEATVTEVSAATRTCGEDSAVLRGTGTV